MSSEKAMKNQQFKTIDMVILIVMVVSLVGVALGIIKHNRSQDPQSQALRMAENISSQLLNLDRKKFHTMNEMDPEGKRIPSSSEAKIRSVRLGPEGIIGEDPWGKPFHYRFVENSMGEWTHLIVWSVGPDQRLSKSVSDWTYDSLVAQGYTSEKREVHMGDDFGLIYSLTN